MPQNASAEYATNDYQSLLKVPKITLYFWIAKLVSTALGEATSDYLVFHTNPYAAVLGCGLLFSVALVLQVLSDRYVAQYYWFAVIMVSIFGTQIADVTHVVLGVPYLLSTALFFVTLIGILILWKRSEGTLSIHSVHTRRREIFYWSTIVATFALGTAAGDMTASSLQLGYLQSGILFTILFSVPVIAYLMFDLNEIAAFWIAYILTRPIGASFADWTDKPIQVGGLGLGTGPVSAFLGCVMLLLLALIVKTRIDDPNRELTN